MIIVLVTARRNTTAFETEAIKVWERFMHTRLNEIKCFFVEAREDVSEVVEEGAWLICPGQEGLRPQMWNKMVHAYRYILEAYPDVTYVVKTNLSSIWHWDRLLTKLEPLPKENMALGVTFDYNYPSGCGTVYSPDIIKSFIDYATDPCITETMLQNWYDDQIMGWLFTKMLQLKVQPTATRLQFYNMEDEETKKQLNNPEYYHIRCRVTDDDLRVKIEIPFMHYAVERWYGLPSLDC